MLDIQTKSLYFSATHPNAKRQFCLALRNKLLSVDSGRTLIFLCIGSDRATGDSLGPLVGQRLSLWLPHVSSRPETSSSQTPWRLSDPGISPCCHQKTAVYGTIRQTIHAGNLANTLTDLHNRFENPYIVAIDASLGIPEHIGLVTLGSGSLRPGIGVSHVLPEAGDIHITGIVNHSTHNNHQTLQTTHLSTVMELASFIAEGILEALHVGTSLQSPQKSHLVNIF